MTDKTDFWEGLVTIQYQGQALVKGKGKEGAALIVHRWGKTAGGKADFGHRPQRRVISFGDALQRTK